MRQIINDMNSKINGTLEDRKINIFSGHDMNVAALLSALQVNDDKYPQYTSAVIIELWVRNGDEYFVKVSIQFRSNTYILRYEHQRMIYTFFCRYYVI